MRYARQNKILELIKENDIDTQEMLVALLKESGFNAVSYTHLTLPTNSLV